MKGFLKVIGSNNQILPLGAEYGVAKLITNKLIVYQVIAAHPLDVVSGRKVLTLDIKNVNICAEHVHVDAWFVDEESNGGRVEFELFWI